MKGKQYIILLLAFFLLIGKGSALVSINLPIEPDQTQFYDLSTSLGVITSNFVVSSLSDFSLTQPFEYQKINFTLSNRKILSSDERQRNDGSWIQVQVYKDPKQTGVESGEIYLSILLKNLKATRSDEVIQEILNYNISLEQRTRFLDAQVAMLNQNDGLVIVSTDETSFISIFQAGGGISYGRFVNLEALAVNVYSNFQNDENKLVFTTIHKNNNKFEAVFREFLLPDQKFTVIGKTNICSETKKQPIIIKNVYQTAIKCIYASNYFYESLYLSPQHNSVLKLTSPKISKEYLGASPVVIFNKNKLQILEKIPKTNIFQLTQLAPLLSNNTFSYQIEQYPIETQINSLLGYTISDQGLISIFTSTKTIGVSVSTKKITLAFEIPQVEDYKVKDIWQIGEQSFILYQKIKQPEITTFWFINLSIPILLITQKSDQKQLYLISQQNTSIILAELETNLVHNNEIQILETEIKKKVIMKSNQALVEIPLEKYVIGSNLHPIVQDFTPSGNVKIETEIKKINQIDVKYLEFFDGKIINNIYSTNNNQFLADTLNEQTKERYLVLYEIQSLNDQYQIQIKTKFKTDLPIQNVDASGFFTLNNPRETVHTIYGYISAANSFQKIVTDCDIREEMMFSSDPLRNIIIILCGQKVQLYSYFAENNYGKIVFSYSYTFLALNQYGIVSMNLNSSGQLILASFTFIYAIDIYSKKMIGSVKVTEDYKPLEEKYVGGFIIFDSSFVIATKVRSNWRISQYSYNNFDDSVAKLIGFFDTGDYVIKIGSLNQGIYGIFNNNVLASSQEYLILEAKDPKSLKPLKLVYRTSGVSIDDQLYAIIPTDQNKFTFISNSYIGEIVSQNLETKFYILSYQVSLQIKIKFEEQGFYDLTSVQECSSIEFKKGKSLKIILDLEKERSSLLQENGVREVRDSTYVELFLKKLISIDSLKFEGFEN